MNTARDVIKAATSSYRHTSSRPLYLDRDSVSLVVTPHNSSTAHPIGSLDDMRDSSDTSEIDLALSILKRPCCPDCGQPNERKGHMGCQYPQD